MVHTPPAGRENKGIRTPPAPNVSNQLNPMASSIIGRKILPAAAAAFTANVASSGFDSHALCEVTSGKTSRASTTDNRFLMRDSGVREAVLRKRASWIMYSFCFI